MIKIAGCTKLLILDNDENFTPPIEHIIPNHFQVVTLKDPFEALRIIEYQNPFAVVISHFPTPSVHRMDFSSKIRALNKHTQQIMIATSIEVPLAINEIKQGRIDAFLIKPTPLQSMRLVILNAISTYHECLAHEKIIPAIRVSKFLGKGYSSTLYSPLTIKEQEVLSLLANGSSNAEIAIALNITIGTVKTHLNNLFGKMDVRSRTKVVAKGMELGLINSLLS